MFDENEMPSEFKPLKAEEVKEIVEEIENQYNIETIEKTKASIEDDEEMKNSFQENAYLAYLLMVRRAKELTPNQFYSNELDAIFDCTYEELEIPEFEDYLKQ